MRPRTPFAALAAALLAVLAVGCSNSEDLGPLGDPTAAQHRIDSLIDGTVKAITPAVTPPQYIGFTYGEERGAFGKETGYAEVKRQGFLAERIADGKEVVLLDQVEEYWRALGCTVETGEGSGGRWKYASATCPDKAHVTVGVESGLATITASVEKTKLRSGGDPFPDTQTPLPLASVTPAGQQDDPYWSH
ncbi:hypothetical protein [Kitasatospora sp. NPDC057198]|uniref:hypothetical protein n=1 Tax=Kitasatospora sp. NPDC057198 TaxID=3346046 RepID=UPI003642BC4E